MRTTTRTRKPNRLEKNVGRFEVIVNGKRVVLTDQVRLARKWAEYPGATVIDHGAEATKAATREVK